MRFQNRIVMWWFGRQCDFVSLELWYSGLFLTHSYKCAPKISHINMQPFNPFHVQECEYFISQFPIFFFIVALVVYSEVSPRSTAVAVRFFVLYNERASPSLPWTWIKIFAMREITFFFYFALLCFEGQLVWDQWSQVRAFEPQAFWLLRSDPETVPEAVFKTAFQWWETGEAGVGFFCVCFELGWVGLT